MERKLISFANKAFVVSLPIKWVKKWKLKKGDPIQIEETNRSITLKIPEKKEEKFILDLSEVPKRFLKRAIICAYTLGYTEIELIFLEEQLKEIEKHIDTLLGVIVLKKDKKIIIKNNNSASEDDFESIFHRLLFIINSRFEMIQEGSFQKIKREKAEELEKELELEEINLKKNIKYCTYLLNKNTIGDYKQTILYSKILGWIELLSSVQIKIIQRLIELKFDIPKNKELFDETILLSQELNKFYFNKTSLTQFYKIRENVLNKKSIAKEDEIGSLLVVAARIMRELVEAKYAIELIKLECQD